MPSIHEYINEIDKWRDILADELNEIKIYASREEKLNTLVPKVLGAKGAPSSACIYTFGTPSELIIIGNVETGV
jgi:hypothetical protein